MWQLSLVDDTPFHSEFESIDLRHTTVEKLNFGDEDIIICMLAFRGTSSEVAKADHMPKHVLEAFAKLRVFKKESLACVTGCSLPISEVNERILAGGLCQYAADPAKIEHAIFVWEGMTAKPHQRAMAVAKAVALEHRLAKDSKFAQLVFAGAHFESNRVSKGKLTRLVTTQLTKLSESVKRKLKTHTVKNMLFRMIFGDKPEEQLAANLKTMKQLSHLEPRPIKDVVYLMESVNETRLHKKPNTSKQQLSKMSHWDDIIGLEAAEVDQFLAYDLLGVSGRKFERNYDSDGEGEEGNQDKQVGNSSPPFIINNVNDKPVNEYVEETWKHRTADKENQTDPRAGIVSTISGKIVYPPPFYGDVPPDNEPKSSPKPAQNFAQKNMSEIKIQPFMPTNHNKVTKSVSRSLIPSNQLEFVLEEGSNSRYGQNEKKSPVNPKLESSTEKVGVHESGSKHGKAKDTEPSKKQQTQPSQLAASKGPSEFAVQTSQSKVINPNQSSSKRLQEGETVAKPTPPVVSSAPQSESVAPRQTPGVVAPPDAHKAAYNPESRKHQDKQEAQPMTQKEQPILVKEADPAHVTQPTTPQPPQTKDAAEDLPTKKEVPSRDHLNVDLAGTKTDPLVDASRFTEPPNNPKAKDPISQPEGQAKGVPESPAPQSAISPEHVTQFEPEGTRTSGPLIEKVHDDKTNQMTPAPTQAPTDVLKKESPSSTKESVQPKEENRDSDPSKSDPLPKIDMPSQKISEKSPNPHELESSLKEKTPQIAPGSVGVQPKDGPSPTENTTTSLGKPPLIEDTHKPEVPSKTTPSISPEPQVSTSAKERDSGLTPPDDPVNSKQQGHPDPVKPPQETEDKTQLINPPEQPKPPVTETASPHDPRLQEPTLTSNATPGNDVGDKSGEVPSSAQQPSQPSAALDISDPDTKYEGPKSQTEIPAVSSKTPSPPPPPPSIPLPVVSPSQKPEPIPQLTPPPPAPEEKPLILEQNLAPEPSETTKSIPTPPPTLVTPKPTESPANQPPSPPPAPQPKISSPPPPAPLLPEPPSQKPADPIPLLPSIPPPPEEKPFLDKPAPTTSDQTAPKVQQTVLPPPPPPAPLLPEPPSQKPADPIPLLPSIPPPPEEKPLIDTPTATKSAQTAPKVQPSVPPPPPASIPAGPQAPPPPPPPQQAKAAPPVPLPPLPPLPEPPAEKPLLGGGTAKYVPQDTFDEDITPRTPGKANAPSGNQDPGFKLQASSDEEYFDADDDGPTQAKKTDLLNLNVLVPGQTGSPAGQIPDDEYA